MLERRSGPGARESCAIGVVVIVVLVTRTTVKHDVIANGAPCATRADPLVTARTVAARVEVPRNSHRISTAVLLNRARTVTQRVGALVALCTAKAVVGRIVLGRAALARTSSPIVSAAALAATMLIARHIPRVVGAIGSDRAQPPAGRVRRVPDRTRAAIGSRLETRRAHRAVRQGPLIAAGTATVGPDTCKANAVVVTVTRRAERGTDRIAAEAPCTGTAVQTSVVVGGAKGAVRGRPLIAALARAAG